MDFQLSKMVNKRIVITGATGFIGTRLLEKLSPAYRKLAFCLVRKGSGLGTIKKLGIDHGFYDILDSDSLENSLHEEDIVLHMAGVIDVRDKKKIRVNIEGMKNLIEASKIKKVRKIIYLSSINAKLKKGIYSFSKYRAEEKLVNSGIDHIIIRPTLVYDDHGEKELKNLVKMVMKLRFFPVIGDGNYRLQPIHVDNLAELIVNILKDSISKARGSKKGPGKRLIEAGGLKKYSFNDMIDLISMNIPKKTHKIRIPVIAARIIGLVAGRFLRIDLKTMDVDKVTDVNHMENAGIKMRDFDRDIKKMIGNIKRAEG